MRRRRPRAVTEGASSPNPKERATGPAARKPLAFIANASMCAAVIVAFGASTPAQAGADPDPGGPSPNPFGGLSCSCPQPGPAGSPGQRQQLIGGMQQGLAVGQREPNVGSSPARPPA